MVDRAVMLEVDYAGEDEDDESRLLEDPGSYKRLRGGSCNTLTKSGDGQKGLRATLKPRRVTSARIAKAGAMDHQ